MPFDANLVLIDGSVNLTSSTDTPAISTMKLGSTGAAVVDLKETGVKGLAAVLIMPTVPVVDSTLTGTLEASDDETFTAGTTGAIQELGKFAIGAATIGVILAEEVPAAVILRFVTKKRYVRANLTVNSGDGYNFYGVQVLLSPHPYRVL